MEKKEGSISCKVKVLHLKHTSVCKKDVFNQNVFEIKNNSFGFKGVRNELIFNTLEGQIDTGLMMQSLLKLVHKAGIHILNNFEFQSYQTGNDKVYVKTNHVNFDSNQLLITTNGFA